MAPHPRWLTFSLASMSMGYFMLSACAAAMDTPLPTVEEVRRGLQARDAAFRNLSFEATLQDRRRFNSLRGAAFVLRNQVADVLIDTSGGPGTQEARIHCVMTVIPDQEYGAKLAQGGDRPSRWEFVTTPGESITLKPSLGTDTPIATIDKRPWISWAMEPRAILALNYASPSTHLVDAVAPKVAAEEVIAGVKTLRIDWLVEREPHRPLGSGRRGSYWIAPELGYSVIRRLDERRPTPSSPWKPISNCERSDHVLIDGLWVPSNVKATYHSYYDDGGYELDQEVAVTLGDWKLNQTLSDSDFAVTIPDGAVVLDEIKQMNYRKGAIDDQMISRQVASARNLALPPAKAPSAAHVQRLSAAQSDRFESRDSWPIRLTVAGSILVLLAAVWYVALRRRNTSV